MILLSALSDSIEKFIKTLFAGDDQIELQRNELAQTFRCAPSQINYVLTTRFSPENGYVISSRRGGGGYIRIIRVNYDDTAALRDIILSYLEEPVSNNTAEAIIDRLYSSEIISAKEAKIILAAISDKSIYIQPPIRDIIRASILKSIVSSLMTNN